MLSLPVGGGTEMHAASSHAFLTLLPLSACPLILPRFFRPGLAFSFFLPQCSVTKAPVDRKDRERREMPSILPISPRFIADYFLIVTLRRGDEIFIAGDKFLDAIVSISFEFLRVKHQRDTEAISLNRKTPIDCVEMNTIPIPRGTTRYDGFALCIIITRREIMQAR